MAGLSALSSNTTMSPDLERLLIPLSPANAGNLAVRLRFGLACCERVAHLLEHPEIKDCLVSFRALLAGPSTSLEAHQPLGERAAALASHHPGSPSLDGVGHAAVSATYACAAAMAGKARQAAEYTAYAMVYGHGGYGATTDPESFVPEFAWQAQQLQALLAAEPAATRAPAQAPAGPKAASVGVLPSGLDHC
jgi:hypothetical protein